MEKYANVFRSEAKYGYSVDSGVFPVVDGNLRMELDEFGNFRTVLVDDSIPVSEHDEALSMVSAMSDESPDESDVGRDLFSDLPSIRHHEALGYYLELFAGHVNVGTYREHGSSGGFTTWILVKLLENDLIDGVIHMTESNGDDDLLFKYSISRTVEEIQIGAKSRYYPGEVSNVLNEVKLTGGRYAITGIPSFIFEVRLLASVDPQIASSIRYYVGLICGHQKSTKYAEAFAWQHGIQPGDLQAIDFRKKNPNAIASRYLTEMHGLRNGHPITLTKGQKEFVVGSWGQGFFKRQFSDFSDDAFNETADVTLGDAWLPQYVTDSMGTNVIIARNSDIAQIINDGIREGEVTVDHLDPDMMARSQRALLNHSQGAALGYRIQSAGRTGKWYPKKRCAHSSAQLSFVRKRIQDTRQLIARKSHIAYRDARMKNSWRYFERRMRPYVWLYHLLYTVEAIQQNGVLGTARRIIRRLRASLPV